MFSYYNQRTKSEIKKPMAAEEKKYITYEGKNYFHSKCRSICGLQGAYLSLLLNSYYPYVWPGYRKTIALHFFFLYLSYQYP